MCTTETWNPITSELRFSTELLDQPLRWSFPRKISVCAPGDLFHESVLDEWIDQVHAVMALCPQHTFRVLTKRPKRALNYVSDESVERVIWRMLHLTEAEGWPSVKHQCERHNLPWKKPESREDWWPSRNVQIGFSVRDWSR